MLGQEREFVGLEPGLLRQDRVVEPAQQELHHVAAVAERHRVQRGQTPRAQVGQKAEQVARVALAQVGAGGRLGHALAPHVVAHHLAVLLQQPGEQVPRIRGHGDAVQEQNGRGALRPVAAELHVQPHVVVGGHAPAAVRGHAAPPFSSSARRVLRILPAALLGRTPSRWMCLGTL